MARRLMVILMSAMIMIGFVSCDLTDMMGAMKNNLAGPNPGKITKVENTIDTIWGNEGSGGSTTVSEGSQISIGKITLPSEVSQGVDKMLSSLSDEDLQKLTASVAQAAANEAGKKALQDSLRKPLNEEDEEDLDKIEATKGSATIIKNMIEKITDSTGREDVKEKLSSSVDSPDSGMPKELRSLFYNLVDGVYGISDEENAEGDPIDITNGDLVIMQTVYTVVDNISDTIFEEGGASADELPPMRDFSEMSTDELSDLIDQLNAGIQVIDAVAPASQFGDVQVSDILKDLLESFKESEEGSN